MEGGSILTKAAVLGISLLLVLPVQLVAPDAHRTDQRLTEIPKELVEAKPSGDEVALGELLRSVEPFFTENRGQVVNGEVLFYATGDPLSIGLMRDGVLFSLRDEEDEGMQGLAVDARSQRKTTFKLQFLGCNDVSPTGVGKRGGVMNYFIGTEEDGWQRGVPTYDMVVYEDLYDDVDLRFLFRDGMVKYEFEVSVDGDADDIVLSYRNIEGLSIDPDSGDMLISTMCGTVSDQAPVMYQHGMVSQDSVGGSYRLMDTTTFAYSIDGPYDRTRSLVIDPGMVYLTYLGGSRDDHMAFRRLSNGDYIAFGYTNSGPETFPITNGSFDTNISGVRDSFIVRFNIEDATFVFGTYIGGNQSDSMTYVIERPDGSLMGCGITASPNFPVMEHPHKNHLDGPSDGFFFLLSEDGSDLLYSTYYGGSKDERINGMLQRPDGTVSFIGETSSPDLDVPSTAYCSTYQAIVGTYSAIFGRIGTNLSNISTLTYVSGFLWFPLSTGGYSCHPSGAIDEYGNVYLAGHTRGPWFNVSEDAYDPSYNGNMDIVVLALDGNCTRLLHSTYIGGAYGDHLRGMYNDSEGNLYFTGCTESRDFPVSPGAYQERMSSNHDSFLLCLSHDLTTLKYGTYFGGNKGTHSNWCILDEANGMIYISGGTEASDLPCTPGCFDSQFRSVRSSYYDAFIAGFDLEDFDLRYCTYIGGKYVDSTGVSFIDEMGRLHGYGPSNSYDLPITPSSIQKSKRGGYDGFFFILDPTPCPPPASPASLNETAGNGFVHLSWSPPPWDGSMVNGYRLTAEWAGGTRTFEVELPDQTFEYNHTGLDNNVTYTYKIYARNSAGYGEARGPVNATPLGRPGMPANLRGNSSLGVIYLEWDPPYNDGGYPITSYEVYRVPQFPGSSPRVVTSPTTQITDDDVEAPNTYTYLVRAANSRGASKIVQTAVTARAEKPTCPLNLKATPRDRMVVLTWDRPWSDGGSNLIDFRIYSGMSAESMTRLADVEAIHYRYEDIGVENGRDYYYTVSAISEMGESNMSDVVTANPFGMPSAPRNLLAVPSDRAAILSWEPPEDDGGRDIVQYNVYMQLTGGDVQYLAGLMDTTHYQVGGLTNGLRYYLWVNAVNSEGIVGRNGTAVEVVPSARPTMPLEFSVEEEGVAVSLTWKTPLGTGGTGIIGYRVYRGTSEGVLGMLEEVSPCLGYVDSNVSLSVRYYYCVAAMSAAGEGPRTPVGNVTVYAPPGKVRNLVAQPHDGSVGLTWIEPENDGGLVVNLYRVYRGITPSDFQIYVESTTFKNFTDVDVSNGRKYYYRVQARNDDGWGELSDWVETTPKSRPKAPINFRVNVGERDILLIWSHRDSDDCFPITGYIVLKGPSPAELSEIARLGIKETYRDTKVTEGVTYYYQLVPTSEEGNGRESAVMSGKIEPGLISGSSLSSILLLVSLVIIVAIVIAFAVARRRREEEEAPQGQVPPWRQPVTARPLASEEGLLTYLVEEVFVVYRDGRLITSCAREECATEDADLMSGMLIAVQGLIQDGLERGGRLESIKYGENIIAMASGTNVVLAAVVYGKPDEELQEMLDGTVSAIEGSFTGLIEEWTGDPSALEGLEDLVRPLIDRTLVMTREDVGKVSAVAKVSLLSAVDFHRGYVRLKAAASNTTEDTLMDAAFEARYDPDMLRLEAIVPDSLRSIGDRIILGNIKPGERKTIAMLFDPQICQSTTVDGQLSYYDNRGELRYVEMKRRLAEVVCPIFFTRENANTAMLRRLIKEELHQTDLRVYRYPGGLSPDEILNLGKAALGDADVQLVREYIKRTPSYNAEVWYFAETKVRGHRFVIRLGVMEDRGVLELFAASTSMASVTGLLADFRHNLEQLLQERHPDLASMELARDELVRREVAGRELFLDADTEEDRASDGPAPRS